MPPRPENTDGDFYVKAGCCTLCDVPLQEAPQLFRYALGEDGLPDSCYVARQPGDEDDMDAMMSAIRCAEFRCIRYRGEDPSVLHRLVQLGESAICDTLSPAQEDERPPRPWWRFW